MNWITFHKNTVNTVEVKNVTYESKSTYEIQLIRDNFKINAFNLETYQNDFISRTNYHTHYINLNRSIN